MRATGLLYGYLSVCRRKIWLAAHRIYIENLEGGEDLQSGGHLDFSSEDAFDADYIKGNTVCEIENQKAELEPAVNRVKFYIYQLYLKGYEICEGAVKIPLSGKTVTVSLSETDFKEISANIEETEKIVMQKSPPPVRKKTACLKCRYHDLCFI